MSYRGIDRLAQEFGVHPVCSALSVSASGLYAWRHRGESHRAREDRDLLREIVQEHAAAHGCYGTPRIYKSLRQRGIATSRKRVARLRRQQGLEAKGRPRRRSTTDSRRTLEASADLVHQQFTVPAPNQVWVGDVTCIATQEGWLYLAILLDLYSRRIVGWSAGAHPDTDLVLEALNRASSDRRPPAGLIHHSDRGSIYASERYRQRLRELGMLSSMSRKGNCYDNAVAESYFATLKTELGSKHHFTHRQAARSAVFTYIEGFYNPRRLHSSLGYRTPLEVDLAGCAQAGLDSGAAVALRATAAPHPAHPMGVGH